MTLPSLVLLAMFAGDPLPVVLSTDIGCEMDDQWALALLALSPSIDLRAVVSSHAPGLSAEASAKVAREVIDRLSLARKPPVVLGSTRPLADSKTPRHSEGVDRLLAESKGFTRDKRLTVVMIGPATDVASALLIDPTIADRIAVVAMAFDDWDRGGDPWNVRNDVAAWQVLLDSTAPLTVSDGAVSLKALVLSRDGAKARFADPSPAATYLLSVHSRWLDRSSRHALATTGSADAWPVWDCGPVAVLLGFATVEDRPRPSLRDDRTFDHERARGRIGWVTRIDGEALWSDFAAKLRPRP